MVHIGGALQKPFNNVYEHGRQEQEAKRSEPHWSLKGLKQSPELVALRRSFRQRSVARHVEGWSEVRFVSADSLRWQGLGG
eukprot:955038-Prymnesium_polylepis.3